MLPAAPWLLALAAQSTDPSTLKVADTEGTYWFPPQASTFAPTVDGDYAFIYWVSVFFLVAIIGVLALFVAKYHAGKKAKAERTATHNTPLELTWSVLPGILLIYMFWIGFRGFQDMRTPPSDAYDVQVTAQKWKWNFTYPGGLLHDELHLEVGRPTALTMQSLDVIHSFFVPAFRVKQDAVPGRYTKLWFTPTRAGTYTALCTEYCGTEHSTMLAKVVVHERGGYDQWLQQESNLHGRLPPEEIGKILYGRVGCATCHTTDGRVLTGPTFQGLWGKTETLSDGSTVLVDENYVRESLLQPNAKVVAGFQPGVMTTFQGRLSEDDINAIIAFLKTLK